MTVVSLVAAATVALFAAGTATGAVLRRVAHPRAERLLTGGDVLFGFALAVVAGLLCLWAAAGAVW